MAERRKGPASGREGRDETGAESFEAGNLRKKHSTPREWRRPMQLARAIARAPTGAERAQAIRQWCASIREVLEKRP